MCEGAGVGAGLVALEAGSVGSEHYHLIHFHDYKESGKCKGPHCPAHLTRMGEEGGAGEGMMLRWSACTLGWLGVISDPASTAFRRLRWVFRAGLAIL